MLKIRIAQVMVSLIYRKYRTQRFMIEEADMLRKNQLVKDLE